VTTFAIAAIVVALVLLIVARRARRYPSELRPRTSSSEGYRRLRQEMARNGEPARRDDTNEGSAGSPDWWGAEPERQRGNRRKRPPGRF
jgi:hypothetical protein